MLGFIIAVVAGFLTPYAEAPLARPLARALEGRISLEPAEVRLIAFMLVMLLAGVAATLLASGSVFWVIFGGILGYFVIRIVTLLRDQIDKRQS